MPQASKKDQIEEILIESLENWNRPDLHWNGGKDHERQTIWEAAQKEERDEEGATQ